MFQPAISAGVAVRPIPCGLWALEAVTVASRMPTTRTTPLLGICRIAYLAIACDAPRPDRVVMIEKVLAPAGEQIGERRLDVAGFVDRAAVDHRRLAAPSPEQTEARECAGQQRLLQRG